MHRNFSRTLRAVLIGLSCAAVLAAPAGAASSENSSRCGGVLESLARLVTHRFCPAIKLVLVSAPSTGTVPVAPTVDTQAIMYAMLTAIYRKMFPAS